MLSALKCMPIYILLIKGNNKFFVVKHMFCNVDYASCRIVSVLHKNIYLHVILVTNLGIDMYVGNYFLDLMMKISMKERKEQ